MKLINKFKILFLISLSFTLMSCPPGKFYDYEYISSDAKKEGYNYTKLNFDKKSTILIKCGYYSIRNKKRGLVVFLILDDKLKDTSETNISVKSSKFGALKLQNKMANPSATDFDSDFTFKLEYDGKNDLKSLKKVLNDTITIEFKKNKIFQFVKSNY